MLRRWAAVLGLLGALSCRGAQEVDTTAPSEIVAVGVVSEGGASSPLAAWPEGAPLPVVTRGRGPHVVYGYTAAQLAPLGEGWRRGRLRPSDPCEARLPAPAWAARLSDGALTDLEPMDVPPMTVDGLREICPDAEARPLLLDVRGESELCSHRISRAGCALEVRTECGAGDFAGWVHPDGGFCARQSSAGDWRCEGAALEPGAPLVCEGGSREVELVDARPRPAPFEVETRSFGPRPEYGPRLWTASRQLYPSDLIRGYVHGLVALSDRVVVARSVGGPAGECWSDESRPAVFSIVDLATLEVLDEVSAPPCALELSAEPGGQTFVGLVLFDDDRYGLGRFDAEGRLLASARIEGASRWTGRPSGLRLEPAQDRLRFFLPSRASADDLHLRAHRLSDLSWASTATIAGLTRLVSVTWLDDDAAILVDGDDTFALVDVARAEIEEAGSYVDGTLYPGRFVSGFSPGPGELVMPMNGAAYSTLYRRAFGPRERKVRLPLEPDFALAALTAWPGGRWLVAGIDPTRPEQPTGFALYDPDADRFEPGLWHASRGVPSLLTTDGEGRVWVAHPWANEISRLSPR